MISMMLHFMFPPRRGVTQDVASRWKSDPAGMGIGIYAYSLLMSSGCVGDLRRIFFCLDAAVIVAEITIFRSTITALIMPKDVKLLGEGETMGSTPGSVLMYGTTALSAVF
ncbi:hypothetical protein Tco_0657345 [Tanacetum coccineum]|uniref:Uncharacterized protein n=1 Tax=Tanacetum coccineum TaxID=301880 RepID=A0ABQ4XBB1_9ASTR